MATPIDTQVLPPLVKESGETKEAFVQRLTFSARGYKGALTRSVSAANKLVDLFDAAPTSLGVTALLEAGDDLDLSLIHI